MGIYFIAAGSSSKNREKSLDRGFRSSELSPFLTSISKDRLSKYFGPDENIYVWGANEGRSFSELRRVQPGEYVVDVKNKNVAQVFEFCCYLDTGSDTSLQEFIGWDREKPKEDRRPYRYVFFLKNPCRIQNDSKAYFQRAFGAESNRNWLTGQRYFQDSQIRHALERTSSSSIESFLGLIKKTTNRAPAQESTGEVSRRNQSPNSTEYSQIEIISHSKTSEIEEPEPSSHLIPDWLADLVNQVRTLRKDAGHQERDHEALVERLFQLLGYEPISEIKYRRGRIDVLIYEGMKPLITVEVKSDWALSAASSAYVRQAYNYSLEEGTRYVIITNGDRYVFYDKDVGRSYEDNLAGEFTLTKLTTSSLALLESMRKGHLESRPKEKG